MANNSLYTIEWQSLSRQYKNDLGQWEKIKQKISAMQNDVIINCPVRLYVLSIFFQRF